ncbi:HAD hydrolase-like protein [Tamlana sp. 2_MG-2023]|uniref:HAD hydrolase-like protein n=1 Tax=unclassified Tamlana TaxID=2614803 RepID=UPI0026E34394|nr:MULTISPECIES: HAD hydrolase-like protein [unclassified Tamlana]MDO6759635.1 HAD hydrolase-like protein [Tamlana sp. 2_MG-2023]MDO6791258.1 HAD hydrolase-like protein [Tamlana sp. 1_MG-2023]
MYLNQLKDSLKKHNTKVLFTDYYDTIVHRTVHPNYTLKLWAKFMIIEFGLNISIDALYFIRQETVKQLCDSLEKNNVEIPYHTLMEAIYIRLVNNQLLDPELKPAFFKAFESIDFKAEASVQYGNQDVVQLLNDFKAQGGKVYLVSDFYGSKTLFQKLLNHHKILDLFDDVFSSAELESSKHRGNIYKKVLDTLVIPANEVMMIGDNKRSDYDHALKNKLQAYQLPHSHYIKKNKRNALGNDYKKVKHEVNSIFKNCKKSDVLPFTQYIIYYHFLVERLYQKCKKENIKNLFFLSREGQYLKKIFDSYQSFHSMDTASNIKTHYLKISRQASMQINLKAINEEAFKYLKKEYPQLSIYDFLTFFDCPKTEIKHISKALNTDENLIIEDFFNSEIFEALKRNDGFISYYENHRKANVSNFNNYINAFDANIEKEGMHLVDIGWGGTMQESIFGFFEEKIKVTGHYLGLRYIYNIKEKTPRDGLIFSILPFTTYNDYMLMANNQYYEQFSAANHGSAVGYTNAENDFVIVKHNAEEKWLYDNYIEKHQTQMFGFHQELLKKLESICYDQEMIQQIISKIALKTGLFYKNRTLKFIETLNSGFYQNIGTNQVGITYEKKEGDSALKLLKTFILTPEVVFRYVTKFKPILYQKNKVAAFLFPSYLIYFYYLLNKFARFKVLKSFFLLKSTYFKNA